MGCGAAVARPTGKDKHSSTQQTRKPQPPPEVPPFMASLQGHIPNAHPAGDEDPRMIHQIEIIEGSFPEKMPTRIECDDIVEFQMNNSVEYDIFQVYKDGNDYYRVVNGYELFNVKNRTAESERRLLLSLALNQPSIELYFCIIPSAQRETLSTTRKCPKGNCEKNCLKIHKCEIKISLTDEKESQKIYIHKGDTVDIDWISKRGGAYRIEERKFCPISGGLYTIEQTDDNYSTRTSAKGKFSKTFPDFGMSFLFRLTDTHQVHDIIVCIVNDTYKVKHIEIHDDSIKPNLIWIEQGDWITFEWNTKRKQTIVQIEPYAVDPNKGRAIELKDKDKQHFFWPHESSRRGFMVHQFNETGLYCYKTTTNHIGTIIVEPRKAIIHIPIAGEHAVHKMNTKDLVQFDWKRTESPEDPVFITIDTNSSVVPDVTGGLSGIFDCALHKCMKVEPFFRIHFNTCETFILNIPQHGLYNFATTDNRNVNLLSIIVENGIDSHRVVYDDDNRFEPNTLIINQYDQVWFDSSSTATVGIYETDEFGNRPESDELLFQPQENSVNYFMKEFRNEGIFYFSTDMDDDDNGKNRRKNAVEPLAIIVVPSTRFHYRSIHKNDFDSSPIVTNINDFVIWQFDHFITHNVIQLNNHERLPDVIASHERAIAGRNRQCLAVECILAGTFFFTNPEFERAAGLEQDRLISTLIVDPPFSQNCMLIVNHQFFPSILHIAQNDTVSWVTATNERNHRIYISSNDNDDAYDQENYSHRNLSTYVPDVHYLHTFRKPGQYTIRSSNFDTIGRVNVYADSTIRSQKKRIQEPQIAEEMEMLSEFGKQVRLITPNRLANILYTLDGSMPTRYFSHVRQYDPEIGVVLNESGLCVIRAYAIADDKIPSNVITSSLTFVLESPELEALNERRSLWNNCKVILSISLQRPNKIYGKIDVEPAQAMDTIDHFEFCINGVVHNKIIASRTPEFSAEGFTAGEVYQVNVIAYPNENIIDAEPIASNQRAFEIRREYQAGAPLISVSLSKDPNTIYLLWAHVADNVTEYIIYVDNIETTTMTSKEFKDSFAVLLNGAQQRRKYNLQVGAKLRNHEIRRSNVIAVSVPMEVPIKGPIPDRFFPYIVIHDESAPADARLEAVELSEIANPNLVPAVRKTETLAITNGLRNAIPRISYKRNRSGITLFWTTKTPAIAESVAHYQIMVDDQPYGKLIVPSEASKYQINLLPGSHECYLEIIPKDENEEIYKTNVLKINMEATSGIKYEPKQQREPNDVPIDKVLAEKDIPIPKLNIQVINSTSIRANWYLDRPVPTDVYAALYEVHIRGQDFSDTMVSDEVIQTDGYTEHICYTQNSPLEINGIFDRQEYIIFLNALFHIHGSKDIEYVKTQSNEVSTARVDPLIDLIPRPMLKVTSVGLQMANLAWTIDETADQKLIKGYRIVLNSKPTEILSAEQHEYELTGLRPGTENEVQVSVTTHPDFIDEKISEPIRIICPQRPTPPRIQSIQADKPFSIAIQWTIDSNDLDSITSFKAFLNGNLHGELDSNGRQSFRYDFTKLQAEQTYSVYIKAVTGQKKLHGYVYQCDVESNISNELTLKCAAPPRGTLARIVKMHSNGVDITWDAPNDSGDVKLTGYQVLKNNRAIGKTLSRDQRTTTINDLDIGNRYSIQILPVTDQPGGTALRTGEEYNADRHGHYLPGPKLEVFYTDLIEVPGRFWVENIAGRSALICWSPLDRSSSSHIRPDGYNLSIWNNQDLPRDKPMVVTLTTDKTSAQLKDLKPKTTYEVQLEAFKKRSDQAKNDQYTVASTCDICKFETGSPPEPPRNMHLIACTNTDARIGFDSFIEHNAEVLTIRVQCEPTSSEINTKDISFDITSDSTEFTITGLTERTNYTVTIYGITDEYLEENRCRDAGQLPKQLKPSEWLATKSFEFETSGCDPASQLNIRHANIESIQLTWKLPKVYGSTKYVSQILRWKLEHGSEGRLELHRDATSATIHGPLPSGSYKIWLDSIISVRISLEGDNDETNRKEICLTTSQTVFVRFRAPGSRERPEIYLTGYTAHTIDLIWNRPNLFSMIDHPEKNNEQLKIHRRLLGYQVDINGRKHDTLDKDQHRCTLTECQPGQTYDVQLIAQTSVQNEYFNDVRSSSEKSNDDDIDETSSEKLSVQILGKDALLQTFQANFEFNRNESSSETTTEQRNGTQSIGKIHVNWQVSTTKDISHFILQWHSSKDLRVQQKMVPSNETSTTIDPCDAKHHYVIDMIIVTNNGERTKFPALTVPIPGEPDSPKLWLVKTSDTHFIVEWSEPKSYGIPIIGYQLFIAGKKAGDMVEVSSRRAEIPSRINRTYQVNVCAITNHPQHARSSASQTLTVITTPTTNLVPTMYYSNDDGNAPSFDRTVARIIPLQIETINEEKLHLDWTSFLPTATVRNYYVHYTCLNNAEVQTMKVSNRFRHTVLRGLRPGFTYGIVILAVDKHGGVLYTSDKSTVQMNAPPNAPIVNITERENTHVKLEWRPAASYGEISVVGYKIFVNNRLAAVLRQDQLTYTLTNGIACNIYTVHVQALSNDKKIVSPMSRGVQFAWPGVKSGTFRRIDDGQSGDIIVAWEHPQIEDETEKLLGYKLISENITTHAERIHGEYDAATQQATIHDLTHGKYRLWLEVQTERNCVRARPLVVLTGRFNTLHLRQTSMDLARCHSRKQRRLRSPGASFMLPSLRHIQES